MLVLNVKFSASAPPGGATFSMLQVAVTDSGANVVRVNKTKTELASQAVLQADGNYVVPFEFNGVGVGPFTAVAQSYDNFGSPMGPAQNYSGNVSLADGVWYPKPLAFV